jgi:hypothetical protein
MPRNSKKILNDRLQKRELRRRTAESGLLFCCGGTWSSQAHLHRHRFSVHPDETLSLSIPIQSVMSQLEPANLEMAPLAMQQAIESPDIHDTLRTEGSLFDNWANDYTPEYDPPQEQSVPLMESLAHQPELPFMCKEQLLLADANQRMSST